MTGGPARLDLLIPLTKPHGQGSSAQQSFEELMRKDEHATRSPLRQPGGEPVRHESTAASRSHAAPIRIQGEDGGRDGHEHLVVHEMVHEARLERLYGVHLLAGGYLSLKAADEDVSDHGIEGIPFGPLPTAVPAHEPDATQLTDTAYETALSVDGTREGNLSFEGPPFVPRMADELEAIPSANADDGIAGTTTTSPAWLAQMERLSISPDGIVTLWIRDFAANGDELTERVAEICRRAASEGTKIGVIVVNGQTWTPSHQGKESDA